MVSLYFLFKKQVYYAHGSGGYEVQDHSTDTYAVFGQDLDVQLLGKTGKHRLDVEKEGELEGWTCLPPALMITNPGPQSLELSKKIHS